MALAAALDGEVEIVSADSMQVYRRMDIGTAKPSPSDRNRVPHHLIDVVDPTEEYSVAEFQAAARQAIAGIESRGHIPLLVGGTALYLRSVVDDLDLPGRYPEIRATLELEAALPGGCSRLHERLSTADPLAASRCLPGNARRIVRALEVCLGSGRPFSSYGPGLSSHVGTSFQLLGVGWEQQVLNHRIERRLAEQMRAGFLDEVAGVFLRGGQARGTGLDGEISITARQALGYRELLAHLEGEISLGDACEHVLRRSRAFAKRQRAWFARDPRVTWAKAVSSPLEALPALVQSLRRPAAASWHPWSPAVRPVLPESA